MDAPPRLASVIGSDGTRLAQLRDAKEGQWLERKSGTVSARDLANVIIGMANAEGGLIVIGIHDGRVQGIAQGDVNGWRQASIDYCVPPARVAVAQVPWELANGGDGELFLIEVEASEVVHHTRGEEYYLRVGDETRKLSAFEAQELVYDKGQSAFDIRRVKETTRDDLDEELVAQFLQRVNARTPAEDVLHARGLFADGSATNAGLLMLGKNPQRFFPEAYIRVITYRDVTAEVGRRANVTADRRFEGAIPRQLDAVRKYLRRRLPATIRLGSDARFHSLRIVPDDAWVEAIVNAVVHRSYSMAGDHIRVSLFPDRMQVESPGRLPGLVRIETIRASRFARNPRIARAVADFGFGRELGEGVDRMFEEMRLAGLPDPEYVQFSSAVRVTLRFDPLAGVDVAALPPLALELLHLLSRVGRATTAELAREVGRSRPPVLQNMRVLQERGLVEHIASAPNDAYAYWRPARRG